MQKKLIYMLTNSSAFSFLEVFGNRLQRLICDLSKPLTQIQTLSSIASRLTGHEKSIVLNKFFTWIPTAIQIAGGSNSDWCTFVFCLIYDVFLCEWATFPKNFLQFWDKFQVVEDGRLKEKGLIDHTQEIVWRDST